jgi:GNAT superfamily N-acetyltransferase
VIWSGEFVDLDRQVHDRDSFDCGEAELNDFIRTQVAKHMAAGISRTLLLPAATALPNGKFPICSFYTVAPGSIKRETLPDRLAKKLPHYPVPIFLLAQLAVHEQYQAQNLGEITLIKALASLWQINAHMRAYAVIVDCLNDRAESFYNKYDFQFLCDHNGRRRLFMPMKKIASLFE